ncbi:hypothetical protein G2W53_024071 [Senna tora]|uniref:Uncharacterized protein n=1 Tax=Senna tora TaxID=362788 RepID=A0A834WGL9_9FABA|nr:hypothetical protein G2W53_024071 [Senna tora]
MSNKYYTSNDAEQDEHRLYHCARKYDIIVKQFDELIEMMHSTSTIPKWKRSRIASASGTSVAVKSSRPDHNEALAEKVTRFLNELRISPTDSGFSSST